MRHHYTQGKWDQMVQDSMQAQKKPVQEAITIEMTGTLILL